MANIETNAPLTSLVTDLEETKNNLVEILNNKGINSGTYESLDSLVSKVNEIIADLESSWAGTLTFSGTYASAIYYTAAGCSLAVDKQKGMAFITMQGGTSTSYENILFSAASLPSGVSMLTVPAYTHASNSAKRYYTCVLTGITGKINVAVAMTSVNGSYDYVTAALTVTYA